MLPSKTGRFETLEAPFYGQNGTSKKKVDLGFAERRGAVSR